MARKPRQERPFASRRRTAGHSIAYAAAQLGCSAGWLRALERGRAPLSERIARKMAGLYRCSLNQLFSHNTRAETAEMRTGAVGVETHRALEKPTSESRPPLRSPRAA